MHALKQPSPRAPSDRPQIVALDGPAGAGKSTVAVHLARRLGIPYLDTGAMYRAVGLCAIRAGFNPPLDLERDGASIAAIAANRLRLEPGPEMMRVWIDDEEVTDSIRSPECSTMASAVSALPEVRSALVSEQQRLGRVSGGVMEGRDIGSVVFPDALLKVFLTASPEIRARRRFDELKRRGVDIDFDSVRQEQAERDLRDTSRETSPLHVSRGAVVVDTSDLTLDEVVDRLAALFHQRVDTLS